MYKMWIQWFFS